MMNFTLGLSTREQLDRFYIFFLDLYRLVCFFDSMKYVISVKLRWSFSFMIQEYAELLEEFMTAVKMNYGEKILVQVELPSSQHVAYL